MNLVHTYCIRLKGNIIVYKDGNKIKAKKLKHRKYHSVIHKNVFIKKYGINVGVDNHYFKLFSEKDILDIQNNRSRLDENVFD